MGDSAGGGLALALTLRIKSDSALPLPAGVAVLSPWVDLSMSGESVKTRLTRDPFFAHHLHQAERCVNAYSGTAALTDPGVSPLFGDLAAFPPLLIQVGSEEILYSDAERFAQKAASAGADGQHWQAQTIKQGRLCTTRVLITGRCIAHITAVRLQNPEIGRASCRERV